MGTAMSLAAAPTVDSNPTGICRLQNELVRLTVDVDHGGRISQLGYLPSNHEYADKKGLCLAIDHFVEQAWPGELMEAKYEVAGQGADEKRAFVKLRRTVTGQWQGKTLDSLSGLVLEKEVWIEAGSRTVGVRLRILNSTSAPKQMQYWVQHIYTLGGDPAKQVYFRPSRRGISQLHFEHGNVGDDWVREPNAGWTAGFSNASGNALVFVMDFQKLEALYNCAQAGTQEWMMEPAAVPPNGAWETTYFLIPCQQTGSPVFASPECVLGMDFLPKADRLAMRLTAQPGGKVGGKLTWKCEGLLPPDRKSVSQSTEPISFAAFTPWTKEVDLGKHGSDDVIVQSEVEAGKKLGFEAIYGGGQAQRITMGLPPNRYDLAGPEKKQEATLVLNLEPRVKKTGRALYVHGLYAPMWKVREALQTLGLKTDDAYFQALVNAEQKILGWPAESAMNDYDVVILADIPAKPFGRDGLRSLVGYVRRGGGLVVLGGPTSYGNGGYDSSILAGLIPFQISGPFDNQPVMAGKRELGQPSGPLPKTLQFATRPAVIWANHAGKPKPGAEVWLKYGNRPFVVGWPVDRGRTVAVTGSVLGVPAKGETPFYEWADWPTVMASLVRWAAGGGSQ